MLDIGVVSRAQEEFGHATLLYSGQLGTALFLQLKTGVSLSCTNVIESAFSVVETVCRNVKRWRDGDQIERWVGSGLLVAEQQFRKVIGYRQIPLLLSSMASAVSKSIAKGAKVA